MSTIRGIRQTLAPNTIAGRLRGSGASQPITLPQLAQALATTTPALSTTKGTQTTISEAIVGLSSVKGVTDGSDAPAGNVGEFQSATLAVVSTVPILTATASDVITLTLSPGDWDVWGTVAYVPASVVGLSNAIGWISDTTAALPPWPNNGALSTWAGLVSGLSPGMAISPQRVSILASTTLYLGTYCVFSGGTLSALGVIQARRVR